MGSILAKQSSCKSLKMYTALKLWKVSIFMQSFLEMNCIEIKELCQSSLARLCTLTPQLTHLKEQSVFVKLLKHVNVNTVLVICNFLSCLIAK